MGATTIYRCPQCGYVTEEVDEGPGLFSPVAFRAFVCQDCQRVISKRTDGYWNLTETDNACDHGHSTNLYHGMMDCALAATLQCSWNASGYWIEKDEELWKRNK